MLAACPVEAEDFGRARVDGCVRCHGGAPPAEGEARQGIERAHPPVAGQELTCVQCHGGDDTTLLQGKAHVVPAPGEPERLLALAPRQLDAVRPERIRFVNPGDLRVAAETCGATGCHGDIVARVLRNPMATFAGDHRLLLYRSGAQAGPDATVGIQAVDGPAEGAGAGPGTVPSLAALEDPTPLAAGEADPAQYMRHYMVKRRGQCHLWSFGTNDGTGLYRSSGCTACHMVYDDGGVSVSADPNAAAAPGPHPLVHELTTAIPSAQCGHCHFEGGRIWPSYQGIRESSGRPDLDPPGVMRRAEPWYGSQPGFYLEREDRDDPDDAATPPDVHFTAGMWCVDCHTGAEVHGDGRLISESSAALEVTCETCHGTAKATADGRTAAGRPMERIRVEGATVRLVRRADGEELDVPQLKTSMESAPAGSALHGAHADLGTEGFNHSERIQCYTCHSGWQPSCYGCHVTVDLSRPGTSLLTGARSDGEAREDRERVVTDALVLMLDTRGRIAPSMPAEKVFLTVRGPDGQLVLDRKVRRSSGGAPGHGQRPINPHTVQRSPRNAACSTCHPLADGSNAAAVRGVAGLGTGRFRVTDGDGVTWDLDRIVAEDASAPVVTVGHALEGEARPLDAEILEGMMSVEAPF